MIFRTSLQKWNIFARSVFPLPNPKRLSSLSISQFDSYAASVCAIADEIGLKLSIKKFNRIEKQFEIEFHDKMRGFSGFSHRTNAEDFDMTVSFLKYLYNIDTKNSFVKYFVQFGSERKFSALWDFITAECIYKAFRKIGHTYDLNRNFWKKIKLIDEYDAAVRCWLTNNRH